MVINGADHTLKNVTVYHSSMVIYNAAGTVAMHSLKVADSFFMGILIVYDANVMGNSKLTIVDSLVLNQTTDSRYAGGLSVFVDYSNFQLTLDIVRTVFSQNSGEFNGGNMAVFLYNSTASVTVSECNFNAGHAGLSGGGLVIFYDFRPSSFRIVNSIFANNEAGIDGGAVAVHQALTIVPNLSMDIINSSFYENRSPDGAALFVNQIGYDNLIDSITISSCTFSNHSYSWSLYGSSVISVNSVAWLKMNDVVVEFNHITAILAEGSNIQFSGSSRISNNTGLSGVGLTLHRSQLRFGPNTDLIITNNYALTTGGGVQGPDSSCFYRAIHDINDSLAETINLTLVNNYARKGGDNYYGLYLEDCSDNTNIILHTPDNDINNPSLISSSPLQIHFGENNTYDVYPGEVSFTDIHLIGSMGGLTTGTVAAHVTAGHASIKDSEKLYEIGIAGGTITCTVYRTSTSNTEKEFELSFKALEAGKDKTITMTFLDCPFGFPLIGNTGKFFECQILSIPVIVNHSLESNTITKRNFSWLGMFEMDNQSHMAANDYCPLDYCNPTVHDIHSYPDYLDGDEQCQYNRTGVLCGACSECLSMMLGT